jgi:hypothetical protein
VVSAVGACEATCAESEPAKDTETRVTETRTAIASIARLEYLFIEISLKGFLSVHQVP